MSRGGWTLLSVLVVVVLAWWGLRTLTWRMQYMAPAFGVGVAVGVLLTLWVTGRRRQ